MWEIKEGHLVGVNTGDAYAIHTGPYDGFLFMGSVPWHNLNIRELTILEPIGTIFPRDADGEGMAVCLKSSSVGRMFNCYKVETMPYEWFSSNMDSMVGMARNGTEYDSDLRT